MGNTYSQLYPPTAKFTEKEVSDLAGKVFLITGASSGIGLELAKILYAHNAKVYVAARSEEKAAKAMTSIETSFPKSRGELVFLHLDLDDLVAVKQSADSFLAKESRLDVLWNNAGVMVPAQGSKTKQGYEAQLGTNCLAPFLFTKLLMPLMIQTAKIAPTSTVRVVWLGSAAAEAPFAPKGGVDMTNVDYKQERSSWHKYGASKAGNILYGREFGKRYQNSGVLSVSLNPGYLKSDLQRHMSGMQAVIMSFVLHPPIYGAYTELFAGLSSEITPEKNGAWIIPWGRFGPLRKDIDLSAKTKAEGGTGLGAEFWEW
ncbi:MAG: hypothetical protein MMC33_008633, partial [Icmadophila ericetorum]|nr:hypothetical protein [Icmadophila ericetorum]